MFFRYKNQIYAGNTAVEIVRDIACGAQDYTGAATDIQEFLSWSLNGLADEIPLRELEVSRSLSDETNALNYLCLLDNYKIGKLYDGAAIKSSRQKW